MTSAVPTIEDYLESFQQLPKIEGTPTYESLTTIRDILKANAASVPSTRGGGANGYLGLVVTAASYNMIAPGTPFDRPPFPGVQPNIPPNSTAAQINEIVRVHNEAKREWRECDNVDKALKKQLTDAVDKIYLRSLRDRHTGFANVTLLAMLTLLFTSYGDLTAQDLADNNLAFTKPWDPNTPFETLIDQMENGREIAEAGNQPITEAQLLNTAYVLVYNTGLYFDDCKLWDRRQEAEKTWQNFQAHFLEAQRLLGRQRRTTQQAGFHGANAITNSEADKHNQTAEALANLATATASDRQAFQVLVETNQKLTETNQKLMDRVSELKDELAALKKSRTSNDRKSNRNANIDPTEYCHTHGYRVSKGHNSKTCRTKAAGHQDEATRSNPMGGSQKGKE